MIRSLAIIGAGNVGRYLHSAFTKKGLNARLFNRSLGEAWEKLDAFNGNFDFTILCVPDDVVAELSEQLPKCKGIIAHSSGTVSLDAISQKHPFRAIFYPPMSLKPESETLLNQINFCLEATDDMTLGKLESFCLEHSINCARLSSEDRAFLHLAAVLSHNFSNYLYHLAFNILKERNLNLSLLKPLLAEQIKQIDTNDPKLRQTGPAVRGDFATMKKHLELLPDETSRKLYKLISNSILGDHEEKL